MAFIGFGRRLSQTVSFYDRSAFIIPRAGHACQALLAPRVASLPELIESARQAGVKLVACTMSIDVMGIKREELIDGLEEAGVAAYLHAAQQGTVNLFI